MRKILLIIFGAMLTIQCYATETKIIVRAKAKDAKFIGSSIGGALVVIKDKYTEKIFAKGITSGNTGSTELIMKTPVQRRTRLTDDATSKFEAILDISEPTFLTIEVYAPISEKQATIKGSVELWLIPGKDILGEGVIIEIPGFIVNILSPKTHQFISAKSLLNNSLSISANVTMMCGCTITQNGIWDVNLMEVVAVVSLNGEKLSDVALQYKEPNTFIGNIAVAKAGNFEIIVYAYDSETGNTGVDKVNYVIQ